MFLHEKAVHLIFKNEVEAKSEGETHRIIKRNTFSLGGNEFLGQ
jgi:hypothetical protein